MVYYILLIAIILLLLIRMLTYKIDILSLLMWMEEKNFPQPSGPDLHRLTRKVAENIWKDITGGW